MLTPWWIWGSKKRETEAEAETQPTARSSPHLTSILLLFFFFFLVKTVIINNILLYTKRRRRRRRWWWWRWLGSFFLFIVFYLQRAKSLKRARTSENEREWETRERRGLGFCSSVSVSHHFSVRRRRNRTCSFFLSFFSSSFFFPCCCSRRRRRRRPQPHHWNQLRLFFSFHRLPLLSREISR